MGLPVSVALRGAARGRPGGATRPGRAVLADLREVDRVFSTWRDDSFVSRLDRGEVLAADGPPEVAEVLALGERARVESRGAFDVVRDGRLDPSGVVKGWAVDRAARHLRAPRGHRLLPLGRRGHGRARGRPRPPGLAGRHRGRPGPVAGRGRRAAAARRAGHLRPRPPRRPRRRRPHRAAPRPPCSPSPSSAATSPAPTSTPPRPSPWTPMPPPGWPPAPPARRTSSGPTAAPRRSPVPDSP